MVKERRDQFQPLQRVVVDAMLRVTGERERLAAGRAEGLNAVKCARRWLLIFSGDRRRPVRPPYHGAVPVLVARLDAIRHTATSYRRLKKSPGTQRTGAGGEEKHCWIDDTPSAVSEADR